MTFYEAIKALEEGKKVRRKAWGSDTYICLGNLDGAFLNYTVGKEFVGGEKFNGCLVFYLPDIQAADWELYKEPILDKEEKEYLENVLRPFKNKVNWVAKNGCGNNFEYLWFDLREDDGLCLPSFKKDTMYKGMKPNKHYTLEELGLFK